MQGENSRVHYQIKEILHTKELFLFLDVSFRCNLPFIQTGFRSTYFKLQLTRERASSQVKGFSSISNNDYVHHL